jgi:uncharacterized RDD family membrane protein YckC
VSIPDNSSPTVRSAEGVELHMPLAGPAPRMLAYGIDWFVLWFGLFALFLLLLLVVPALTGWLRDQLPTFDAQYIQKNPRTWLLPFMIFFVIVGYFGELLYFLFWETVSGGSSPGKWLVGLRVVRLDGLRIGMRASCIRNLMRAADVLPSSYVVGLTSMLISLRSQRLGDLAAGTLVVRLDKPERAVALSIPPDLSPLPLSREQLQRLGDRERTLVRNSLRRAGTLQGERRLALLATAASALSRSLQLEPEASQDPELFLRRLWLAMQQSRSH